MVVTCRSAELGDLAFGADDVMHEKARRAEAEHAEQRRPKAHQDHRLPSDVASRLAVASAFVLRHERRGRGRNAVADDGAHRCDLIADADRPEARPRDVSVEPRDEIGVDEVERRLQRHAERERCAEASQRAGEWSGDDSIARLARAHGDKRSSRFFLRGSRGATSAGVRSKQVSGTLRFCLTRAVASTKRSVTGSW